MSEQSLTIWVAFRFPIQNEDIIAMRMRRSEDKKELSSHLVLCSLFCELECCSFYFIHAYQTITAWGHRFCVQRAVMYMTFLTLPFSHIHIRVPATAQQLLKHIFGASTKSFPRQPQSFVGYDSICLCRPLWKLPRKDRTNPAKKAISLHNVQDFLKKHFVTPSLLEKGMHFCFLLLCTLFASLYILHFICPHMQHTHHNSFYAWVQWLNIWNYVLSFHIM